MKEITLIPSSQKITIKLGANTYILVFIWRGIYYVMDVYDRNNNPIATGLPIVTGVDITNQLSYLNIVGKMEVLNDANTDNDPSYTDLGILSHLMVEV